MITVWRAVIELWTTTIWVWTWTRSPKSNDDGFGTNRCGLDLF